MENLKERGYKAVNILRSLADLLFPAKCPFCGVILPRPGLCDRCGADVPGDYYWNGSFLCAAPLRYEGAVRECLRRFKFHGDPSAARPLGMLMAVWGERRLGREFDIVTWAPVSRQRRRKRGYDQCRAWNRPKPRRLLRKIRNNPAQSGLRSAGDRASNVRNVYAPVSPERIRGRRILLIDDICTTGATLGECRRILLDAGAEDVACLTAAVAGDSRTP